MTSFAPLRKIPPKVPFETLRKITQYFPTADSEHTLNPTYEDTEPTAIPDTQYFPTADSEHTLNPTYEDTEPTAIPENVKIFKDLQKYQSVGLVVPVDAEFMYFAAINSTSCRLTALGYQYWRLVNEKKL